MTTSASLTWNTIVVPCSTATVRRPRRMPSRRLPRLAKVASERHAAPQARGRPPWRDEGDLIRLRSPQPSPPRVTLSPAAEIRLDRTGTVTLVSGPIIGPSASGSGADGLGIRHIEMPAGHPRAHLASDLGSSPDACVDITARSRSGYSTTAWRVGAICRLKNFRAPGCLSSLEDRIRMVDGTGERLSDSRAPCELAPCKAAGGTPSRGR
jgi:hypothetical protein